MKVYMTHYYRLAQAASKHFRKFSTATLISISQDNRVKVVIEILSGVLAVLGYFIVILGGVHVILGYFGNASSTPTSPPTSFTASQGGIIQTSKNGINAVNTDSGTININIGITPEQYEQGLKRRGVEVRTELEQAHSKDRQRLETELQAIQTKLQNSSASYERHITSIKQRIAQLESLQGKLPDDVLVQAKTALAQGDSQQADQLFKQIEEQTDSTLKVAAEIAYQRCKIAEEAIHYFDALKHCQKAARLAPENTRYLNHAGLIHQ